MKYFLFILMTINLFANEDENLLLKAYQNGLKPVPSNFTSLLNVLKTDSQEISKDKITLGKKLFNDKNRERIYIIINITT